MPLCFIVLLAACSKNKDANTILSEVPVVTGYTAIDVNDQPIGTVGSPNILTDYKDASLSVSMRVYPIPASDNLSMYMSLNATKDVKIWITRANAGADLFPVFNFSLTANNLTASVYENTVAAADYRFSIPIDVSKFAEGYYRLYASVDGHILYDNIVVKR